MDLIEVEDLCSGRFNDQKDSVEYFPEYSKIIRIYQMRYKIDTRDYIMLIGESVKFALECDAFVNLKLLLIHAMKREIDPESKIVFYYGIHVKNNYLVDEVFEEIVRFLSRGKNDKM